MVRGRDGTHRALEQVEDDIRALQVRKTRLEREIEDTKDMFVAVDGVKDEEVSVLSNIKETLLTSKRRELEEIEDDLTGRLARKTSLEQESYINTIIFVVVLILVSLSYFV